ncbi:MAG: anti-sigma factor [Elusimicrobia bacterium]|nr:anti-sigma factor [Elusimicrobiota bacterium]
MRHEKENLSGYLDGAAADAERGRIEAHLKDCAECRAELEDLRKACGMVKGLPQKPLPAGFLQRLENRRRQETRTEGWASLLAPRNAAWAACAFAVIFVTYKTLNLQTPPRMAEPLQGMVSGAASDLKSVAAPPPAGPAGPVTVSDLVALSKEQRRAEGIAALRGADAGAAGISAAGLSAPAAPKGFGGRALDEAPAAKPAYSNEALQKHLEAERARMGIQRILTPNSVVRALRGAARDLAPAAGPSFVAESVPAPLVGQTSTLLAQPQGPGRSAAEGALVPPEDFSGGRAPAKLKKEGVPLPAAAPLETGRAVYSMEESVLL